MKKEYIISIIMLTITGIFIFVGWPEHSGLIFAIIRDGLRMIIG